MTLLGISIGTTRTGICVLRDEVLLDRQIHNYQAAWTDSKLRIIVNKYQYYIRKYNVTDIIVKIPPLGKHTNAVSKILRRVEKLAAENHCEFDLITKIEMKHITGTRSTEELIKYASLLYPELSNLYDKGMGNEHCYYKKLYEAVLAAYIFQERQKSRELQLKSATE
jgi:RNase H-fold protein (predicted Holliday junction resolvase)